MKKEEALMGRLLLKAQLWPCPRRNFNNVRFGSLADITARSCHVRFTPDSGHSSVQEPKKANNRRRLNE